MALVVGTFAALGLALALAGYTTTNWARVQFLTGAGGSAPQTFGPVFVALSVFQTTVTLFFAGPVVATVLGLLSGSRFRDRRRAGVVAGGGALVGFFAMAGLGLLGIAAVTGIGQAYSLGQAVGPLLLSGVGAAVAGGVAGVMGSAFVR